MEKVIQDENVTLYLWANLKKNPKYACGWRFPYMCDTSLTPSSQATPNADSLV
jgi:hypothetical protein